MVHYLDLVNRGLNPTPVGVSDSHSHRGGVGENMTWVPIDIDDIGEMTPDHIRYALGNGRTVPSTGPMIEARVGQAWAPGHTFTGSTELDVTVWATDWMPVDTLTVYENGEAIDSVAIENTAPIRLDTTIDLNPAEDAVYVIEVTGTGDMAPVYPGAAPWAATSAIRIDVDNNGWTAPLPSIQVD